MIQYNFVPFAIETVGSLGAKAKGLVNALGRRLSGVTGAPKSTKIVFTRFLLPFLVIHEFHDDSMLFNITSNTFCSYSMRNTILTPLCVLTHKRVGMKCM